MNNKRYKQMRVFVAFWVMAIVGLAVTRDSYLLALAGVITGMVFMAMARSRTKKITDEREAVMQEKAARMAYAIFAPTIGIGAVLLLLPSKSGLGVFSKGEFLYIEGLGMVLAYLTLFLIAIYAISYFFLNRKYGGTNEE